MTAGVKHLENHNGDGASHTLNSIYDKLAVIYLGCDCESCFTMDALIALGGIQLI